MENYHIPVLLNESLELLVTEKSGAYFDGTVGFGGHSKEILRRLSKDGILIATDKDINAFNYCENIFKDDKRAKLYHASFIQIKNISKIESIGGFDGIFADLGVSSFQLDEGESGFSYRSEAPLDLRMDKSVGIPASQVVNTFDEGKLADIFFKYGEEKKSRQIARKIAEARNSKKLILTTDLKNIIEKIVPGKFLNKTLSRIFQALRIYVNNELDDLKIFIDKAVEMLNPGGRLAFITFHSLEDRIVKEAFKAYSAKYEYRDDDPFHTYDKKQVLKVLTKKPIVPTDEEIKVNRRARSAKLRAAEKL